MHLNTEELVDLAEGTRPESSAPHLAGCEACRRQLTELRAMMSAAAEVAVPEPSPLFWEHLSDRVRDVVAAGELPRSPWLDLTSWRRRLMPLSAVAAAVLVIAVLFNARLLSPRRPQATGPAAVVATAGDTTDVWVDDPSEREDASLTLVANLTADLDLDSAREAGLAPSGSAEHAVTHMGAADLRELRRILKEELARPGA